MLRAEQEKCIELMVAGEMNQRQIADEINVTPKTICEWKKNDEFIETYNACIRKGVQDAAAGALRTMVDLSKHAKSEMVRFNAAKDILDRAGFKPEDNINLNGSGMVVIVDDCDQ